MDAQTLTLTAPIQELIESRLMALRPAPFMAAHAAAIFARRAHGGAANAHSHRRLRTRGSCGRCLSSSCRRNDHAASRSHQRQGCTRNLETVQCRYSSTGRCGRLATRCRCRAGRSAPPALGSCGRGCIGPGGQVRQRTSCLRRCNISSNRPRSAGAKRSPCRHDSIASHAPRHIAWDWMAPY